jgi:signal transduction histidine kinase/HAMP domain-containing protein
MPTTDVPVSESASPMMPLEPRPRGLRNLFFGTIQNKIILPFLILTLLVTMMGTYIVTRLVASSIQDRLTTQLLDTSRAASDSIVAWERYQLDILRLVVFTVSVPESLEAGDQQPLTDALVALAANQNVYLLLAIDTDGRVIASAQRQADSYSTEALIGQNLGDQAFIQPVLNGEADAFGDKYAGILAVDGQPVLLTVAPVHGASGELVGAVAMGTPLRQVLNQTKIETLADLTLFQSSGAAIQTTFVLADNSSLSSLGITPEQYQETISGSEDETPFQTFLLNEREYQTAYVPLVIRRDELGVLGVSWPSTLVTSVIITNRNGLAVMFSLVAMLVVLIGYMVAHNLTRPIRRLADVARNVAAGDLSQQSKVRTSDEIGVLGRIFDSMTINLHDKTEALVESYQEQERKSAFLSAVISSAADGTVVVDPEGATVLHENPAATEIIAHDEVLWSFTFRELARETRESGHALTRLAVKDLWYEAKAAPITTLANEDVGIVMTLRDITEEVLTDRMRTAFILQMSHELYTPLVTARGYTELAKSTIGSKIPLAQEMLDQSMLSMRELRGLISQILDISRMIKGGFEITPEKVELAELLHSVIDEYRELAESKNLKLQVDAAKLQPYSGGREPLRWAFKHLIKNACDYTLPGGVIRITASDEDGCFMLKVRDTGVGIARHEKAHLFEQFFRGQPVAPDGTVIDIRGAGLGLFVVDQVVRAHQGEIEVWSEQGIGSEFLIRLRR